MALEVNIQKQLGAFCLQVDFTAQPGVLGILGASGCGKSMTLRCIAGIEQPDQGRIALDGRPWLDTQTGVQLPPQQRGAGFLFQNYALFPTMTVEQNLLAGLHRLPRRQRKAHAQELMRRFELTGLAQRRPAQLSGGQQQRVALARMLAAQPLVTLLDEPFSALDASLREALQLQLQATLQEFGGPAILVSHDRDEIYRLCQHTLVMDQGRVVAFGPTQQLFLQPECIAAARLTGCKNILPARCAGPFAVFVPDWGCTLTTSQPVPPDLAAIGVRAHDFAVQGSHNPLPVSLCQQMEDPFFYTYRFAIGGGTLWWKVSKQTLGSPRPQLPRTLYLPPQAILLLRA